MVKPNSHDLSDDYNRRVRVLCYKHINVFKIWLSSSLEPVIKGVCRVGGVVLKYSGRSFHRVGGIRCKTLLGFCVPSW